MLTQCVGRCVSILWQYTWHSHIDTLARKPTRDVCQYTANTPHTHILTHSFDAFIDTFFWYTSTHTPYGHQVDTIVMHVDKLTMHHNCVTSGLTTHNSRLTNVTCFPYTTVLQRVAACCSMLQCVAVCWMLTQMKCCNCDTTCSLHNCSVAVCCSVLQRVAVCRSVLQCVECWRSCGILSVTHRAQLVPYTTL